MTTAEETLDLINWLRRDEMSSVEIVADRPDAFGCNSLVRIRWDGQRQDVIGESVLQCLRAAKAFRESYKEDGE